MTPVCEPTHIVDLLNQNTSNIFYTSTIHQLENLVLDDLQTIMATVLELIGNKKINRQTLDELNKTSAKLAKSYYNKYIHDTMPYFHYYIANRIAMDIQRLILQTQKYNRHT
jgi:hypothetical protein